MDRIAAFAQENLMQLRLGTTMMTGTDIDLQHTDDNVSMLCIFAKKNQ